MSAFEFQLGGTRVCAHADGSVFLPGPCVLSVGDLHLGRSERTARQGGGLIPPYETRDTLDRLEAAIDRNNPRTVVLVGDSFDDTDSAVALAPHLTERINRMAAGRSWIWITGNHDPGPIDLPGTYRDTWRVGRISFRHIAQETADGPEISAHYHPKAVLSRSGTRISRKCHLVDNRRAILAAFGTYTGGLKVTDPAFDPLMETEAVAVLLGKAVHPIPRARLFV